MRTHENLGHFATNVRNYVLFPHGQVVITRAANDALLKTYASHDGEVLKLASSLVALHVTGDFGDICDEDKQVNLDSIRLGNRVMSVYKFPTHGLTLWVITEADRSVTTILLPEEY